METHGQKKKSKTEIKEITQLSEVSVRTAKRKSLEEKMIRKLRRSQKELTTLPRSKKDKHMDSILDHGANRRQRRSDMSSCVWTDLLKV